jgi:hypothetical protein
LRYKQSSLITLKPSHQSTAPSSFPGVCFTALDTCIQAGPNWSAIRTPCHGTAGWGGFQRRLPTGGAAYGIPRNDQTPQLQNTGMPTTVPPSTLTRLSMAAKSGKQDKATKTANIPTLPKR